MPLLANDAFEFFKALRAVYTDAHRVYIDGVAFIVCMPLSATQEPRELKLPEEQLKLLLRGEWWLKYSRKLKLDRRCASTHSRTELRTLRLRNACRRFRLSSDRSALFWLHKNAKRTAETSMHFDAMQHILYGPDAVEELQKNMNRMANQADKDVQSHIPEGASVECLV